MKNYFKSALLIIIIVFFIFISLNFISAANCWQYNSSSDCTALNGCKWKNDSWSITGWCEELNCWSLNTQSECTTTNVPGKNCTWQGGGTTYGCEKLSCMILSGTNESLCVNNTKELSCEWQDYCFQSGMGSPNCYQYQNQSSCLNATSCAWGNCVEKGCWSYYDNATCNAAKDFNGRNCTWNSNNYCQQNGCWQYYNQTDCDNTNVTKGLGCQWKYDNCQYIDCYAWDFTNATACVNNTANLSCSWSGSYCQKQDCWNYNTQASCQNQSVCNWKAYVSSGWCNEVNCWSWDSMNGGSNSSCVQNASIYGLNCIWSGNPTGNTTNGWCYKNWASVSCSNKTTERECMDTYYCWWQYTDWTNPNNLNGTCNSPGSFGGTATNTTMLNDWNPGCYIFDMNATDCNNTLGCNYTNKCVVLDNAYGSNITLTGINCSYINDSQLCNNIPALSSCCSWQNASCSSNKLSTSCWDQMKQKTEDSCEDAETTARCNELSNYPWYMPCSWSNSTSKCGFKASDVFGNETQSLAKIDNKKNCEAAGGKWITENYCEGNISVPTGRCEYKFDEEDNCDKACFACEIKDSNGNSINASNANSACTNSKLGICGFYNNTNAPNGIGYCKAKEQFKKGIAGDCDSNCGDCTYKGDPNNNDTTKRPSDYCANSKANSDGGGCKWITDNSTLTGGYCVNKGEKICEDSCDRCKTQTDCSNIGRTAVSNQTGSCKWEGSTTTGSCVANIGEDVEICWDGIDNTDDELVDCADPSCYADSSCGFVSGDCFGWTTQATCNAQNLTCEWVTDKWGSWCDFKGSQCWKYNQNESICLGAITITNESLNISAARLAGNNINISKAFTPLNVGGGLVAGSVSIINASGQTLTGNFTIDYTANTINFSNTSFMVLDGGKGNWTNITYMYKNSNCQWSNGTGSSWCEKDCSTQETCMSLNRTNCMAANASGCNWTVDTWCSGTGNGTIWCTTGGGGWCDNVNFKPKDCWKYSASASCGNASGCGWRTNEYSIPHCENNWSANCWLYADGSTCNASTNCIWDVPPQGGGWCMNKADKCGSYTTNITCNSAYDGRCYWQSWGTSGGSCQSICWNGSYNTQGTCDSLISKGCVWKAENGWCEESAMATCSDTTNMNNQTACQNTTGCRWKNPGWCDPKGGGFSAGAMAGGGGVGSAMGGDCFKYDGNQSLCTNKSIINISCGWATNTNPKCEVDWNSNCWQYISSANCNASVSCWWNSNVNPGYCTNIMDQCWSNTSYQSWNNTAWAENCSSNYLCTNNSWGGCEPQCFSLNSSSCVNATFTGKCKYMTGWCNPTSMNQMFDNMQAGAPAPLGQDDCGEGGMQASVDICGFGMKDMGDAYGFGIGVNNFENASVCNKEKLSSFVMGMVGGGGGSGGGGGGGGGGGTGTTFGTERTGTGNDTLIVLVYLDTDGSRTGGCMLSHNSSAVGYEFRFKYSSQWNSSTSKAIETFNAYKCEDSSWKVADIKLSTWKTKMCSDIGGPMIAVKKADLTKFPTLYDSTKDMRVFVATIGNTGNISSPTDRAGPGWTTPGSIDFEIKGAFEYGADTAKFEDILKKGFVQGEDCFNGIDDDGDGNVDCNDWDCQYSDKCSLTGVNATGYVDTSTPLVTGFKIEEYPDSALIMYDTNKPTNGTLELYNYGDTQCLNKTYNIYDIGILSTNVRDYKTWHTAFIYETNETMNGMNVSINWPLVNGSTYNYKIKVCDSNNKCAVSKCSSIKTSISVQKCAYCNFVTRIKAPTGWNVSYDVDRNGVYEHVQGQVCGPNAGMKTNYTSGRKVNIKLAAADGSTYIEFLNASLTKSGLNDKVRTISSSGDIIHSTTGNYVGLTSETRDKIINNLHPEVCRIKIPVASGATCDKLYHCDDSGNNCVDRTSAATLISSTDCIWNVPYCEFSTYKTSAAPGGSTTTSGGGGGGGGASTGKTFSITETQFTEGYTQNLAAGDKIKVKIENETHYVTADEVTATSVKISVNSTPQQAILTIGETKKFDVTEDGYYDLSVKLNSIINATKANVTIKSIYEQVTEEIKAEEEQKEKEVTGTEETLPKEKSLTWLWILIVIVVVIIVGIVYWLKNKE